MRRAARASLALLPLCSRAESSFADDIARQDPFPTLEELAYRYGTDKSKDDHKYVDFYMLLFDPIRFKVRNMTEVGIASGQSLQMWIDYFSEARIWGIDKKYDKIVFKWLSRNPQGPRVELRVADCYNEGRVARLNLANESMDVIIDDAAHDRRKNLAMLIIFWRFLRPGGYYIIEDAGPPSDNMPPIRNEPTIWNEQHIEPDMAVAANIIRENTAFVVDPTFGHRNFTTYANTSVWGKFIHANGRLQHNSHLIVLRKRTAAHPPQPWRQFFGEGKVLGEKGGAMTRTWISDGGTTLKHLSKPLTVTEASTEVPPFPAPSSPPSPDRPCRLPWPLC